MTTIYLPVTSNVTYPVGNDIASAANYARNAALIFNERYGESQRVNVVCRGSSGAMLAALFVSHLKSLYAKVIHVKKEGEYSHTGSVSSYLEDRCMVVIIDDFISSGATIRKIYEAVVKDKGGPTQIDVLIVHHGYRHGLGFKPVTLITKFY